MPWLHSKLLRWALSKKHTNQKLVWLWWCVGWYHTVLLSCFVSNVHFNCIVQDSLYHNMDIGTICVGQLHPITRYRTVFFFFFFFFFGGGGGGLRSSGVECHNVLLLDKLPLIMIFILIVVTFIWFFMVVLFILNYMCSRWAPPPPPPTKLLYLRHTHILGLQCLSHSKFSQLSYEPCCSHELCRKCAT